MTAIMLAMRLSFAPATILAAVLAASCSVDADQTVRIGEDGNRFTLKLRSAQIEGLCYAPQSIQPNGYLELDALDQANSWKMVLADPVRVEGLDAILSAQRVRIGTDGVTLPVPKGDVIKRPFDLQFVAFPCDAPTKTGMGKIWIVSITADLPPVDGRS